MSHTPLNSPFSGGSTRIVQTTEPYDFRGQHFQVSAFCYEDEKGDQFTTDEQDQQFLDELHRLWRERNQVPVPAQLKARREALGLSAAEVSGLLGFGINVYRQYEAGELPSESNSRMLKLYCDADPAVLAGLVRAAGEALATRTKRKLSLAQGHTPPGSSFTPRLDPALFAHQQTADGGRLHSRPFTVRAAPASATAATLN